MNLLIQIHIKLVCVRVAEAVKWWLERMLDKMKLAEATPYQKRRNMVAAATVFFLFLFATALGPSLLLYLLTTRVWWLAPLYLLWLYHDRSTPEQGGRLITSIANCRLQCYGANHFPLSLSLSKGFALDAHRNYLFCCFPHGVIPVGPFCNLSIPSNDFKFHRLYPAFKVHIATLNGTFFAPFMRELGMAMGFISCSAKSLNHVLSRPEGGHVVLLNPGGAVEAYDADRYKFVVKKRKGFVKLALKNGSPLVPVISFGETDVFYKVESQKFRRFQELVRKCFGFAPVLFYGRGFAEGSFGIFPRGEPLSTVLGKPIDVERVENPTNKQIDELHDRFMRELVKLFDEFKHKYLERPDEKFVELD